MSTSENKSPPPESLSVLIKEVDEQKERANRHSERVRGVSDSVHDLGSETLKFQTAVLTEFLNIRKEQANNAVSAKAQRVRHTQTIVAVVALFVPLITVVVNAMLKHFGLTP